MLNNGENHKLVLAVIIGSTREGRFAETITRWFVSQANERKDMAVDVIDLAKTNLPTTLLAQATPEVEAFTAKLASADAFVVVTPEYNHGYPASLKNALDWVYKEWRAKPVGFVSYGGISGGLRAVEQLRQVFAELHSVTVRDTVSFHRVFEQFDESGQPKDPAGTAKAAGIMLNQLGWWGRVLREGRLKQPYEG